MKRSRGFRLVVHLILVGVCCFLSYHWAHFWYRGSLRPDNPPEAFEEIELAGMWKVDYRRYSWGLCGDNTVMREARSLVEWLVLREDKTFHQVLQDREGKIPDQWAQGTWWVERFSDGVTRLRLEGGRFFAGSVCYSYPKLNIDGGSYSSDQTGHELSFDRGKTVIIVGWDKFTRELYLEYPFVCSDPDAPIIVEFERVLESESVPIPTSSRQVIDADTM